MELLIPFFEKRKENLSHYGIEQCLIIDHHPNWQITTTAVINVGKNGFDHPPGEGAESGPGGKDVLGVHPSPAVLRTSLHELGEKRSD
jgi:hypothetical protein